MPFGGGDHHLHLQPVSMELPGLSFHPGIGVQDVIKSKFGCSVSPITPDRTFFLVASFGRCKFRLSSDSVGFILQATLGGTAADFSVLALSDRVFRFSVSSRWVGLGFTFLSFDLLFAPLSPLEQWWTELDP